ncbi:MAG: bifunctional adenosylcobinamide kinase/adenosylcobinamide-phosphate guanylyltransferase [Oribacterium sp.]|nr:bifunctional adenosylcobinamide kinase/adenosylcobinamide-phosphate guanylyltransferase [Oribacterium sp.]
MKNRSNMGRLYYITGGAGSGKSEYAEQLAERLHTELGGPLYYVATMNPAPRDADAAARIAKHQKRRAGRGYTTLECPTDIAQLRAQALNNAVFLLEDLTNLYANEVYGTSGHPNEIVAPLLELRQQAGALIIVANELYSDGIDYGPETDRFLRDLADLAAALSAAADQVTEVVYGIPVQLKA